MSMSSHIVAFSKPDAVFMKMLNVYNACNDAGVDLPEEVSDFFDGGEPDPKGVEIQIKDAVEKWSDSEKQCTEDIKLTLTNFQRA